MNKPALTYFRQPQELDALKDICKAHFCKLYKNVVCCFVSYNLIKHF